MSKLVAIANQKGGVGKTTTSVNLSSCVGKAGKKVLLIDIDPQANATSGAGIDRKDVDRGTYEWLIGEAAGSDVIRELPWEGLSIIPANRNLSGVEVELIEMEKREYYLSTCIHKLNNLYDFIFIDCPPSLGLLTVNALTAADSVLMPIQCEYYALEGLGQLLETFNLVKRRLNPLLEVEGIVLTMADMRTNLSQQVIKEVRGHFGKRVFNTVIPRNIKLSEAPGFGKPIIEYDIRSVGAESYMEFAREFIDRNEGTL
jgi:chromosome partitioning protein